MKDAAILDGDYVVIRSQDSARSGEIVAALMGEEATVKRLHREDDRITLLPENEAFEPIPVRPEEGFRILGKVVGIFRRV
jgi:repressor LexA